VLVVAVALASSDAGRDLVRSIFTLADGLIAAHPRAVIVITSACDRGASHAPRVT
jgi:hypothetical protein